tara:strand:- start:418 stop:1839 length:1422 start_codon:yes stop_codon:yes gene_type:complete
MAFDFPNPPGSGPVTNPATGVTYQYDAASQTWVVVSSGAADSLSSTIGDLQGDTSDNASAISTLQTNQNNQDGRITALENAPAPTQLTYQIGTDKVMRAGEPSIELVDSEGYYSNVKFQGTGGIAVSSDLQSIIIDGSNIDAGVSDVNLSMVYAVDKVIIKVNGSTEAGVTINSAGNYAAGVLSNSDWKKLTAFETADSYYTKDEIDNQFSLRGVGYTYLFSSFMGGITIRGGEVHTDNRIVGQITQISIAPEDDNGKQRRDSVIGDTLEIYDTITGKYYRYLINQGSDGNYGVTWQGSDDDRDDFLSMGQAYLFYMYPTHISSADYYTKNETQNLYLKKTEGTAQTLRANVKYTGLIAETQHLVHKGYVDSQIDGVYDAITSGDYASLQYVNDEVDKMAVSLSAETAEPDVHYGDYAPTGTRKDGDMWFDSMNLRLNIWSQGAWINPDRNDGKDLENRISALETRLAQLEGN